MEDNFLGVNFHFFHFARRVNKGKGISEKAGGYFRISMFFSFSRIKTAGFRAVYGFFPSTPSCLSLVFGVFSKSAFREGRFSRRKQGFLERVFPGCLLGGRELCLQVVLQ
jgi:hypothetical protein